MSNHSALSSQSDVSRRKKLEYTINYVYENVDFYTNLFDEVGISPDEIQTVDDINKIPIVNGEDILSNQPPVTEGNAFKADVKVMRPFQSTGMWSHPKTIFHSYSEYEEAVREAIEIYRTVGVTEESRVASFNPHIGFNLSGPVAEDALKEIGCTFYPFATTPLPPKKEMDLLFQYDPDVVFAYPSEMDTKGKEFIGLGEDPASLDLESIIVGGEPISAARKQNIEEMFEASLLQVYAATEVDHIATQCPMDHGTLHIHGDNLIVEIVDEDGNRVPEGDEGKLVLTQIYDPEVTPAMPMVRYEVGDRARFTETPPNCTCDIPHMNSITAPIRSGHRFTIGPTDFSIKSFTRSLYNDNTLSPHVKESQIKIKYDAETGKDILTYRFERIDDTVPNTNVHDVSLEYNPENKIERFGQELLRENQNLREYVDVHDLIQFNIEVVDDLDNPPGKPIRVIDERR